MLPLAGLDGHYLWHELFLCTYVAVFSFEFGFLLFLDLLCRFRVLRSTQHLSTFVRTGPNRSAQVNAPLAPWEEHPPSKLHRSKDTCQFTPATSCNGRSSRNHGYSLCMLITTPATASEAGVQEVGDLWLFCIAKQTRKFRCSTFVRICTEVSGGSQPRRAMC